MQRNNQDARLFSAGALEGHASVHSFADEYRDADHCNPSSAGDLMDDLSNANHLEQLVSSLGQIVAGGGGGGGGSAHVSWTTSLPNPRGPPPRSQSSNTSFETDSNAKMIDHYLEKETSLQDKLVRNANRRERIQDEYEGLTNNNAPGRGGGRKRPSAPPFRGEGKGMALDQPDYGMIDGPYFQRGRYSPGRHRTSLGRQSEESIERASTKREDRSVSPRPIVINAPSGSVGLDDPQRSDLATTPLDVSHHQASRGEPKIKPRRPRIKGKATSLPSSTPHKALSSRQSTFHTGSELIQDTHKVKPKRSPAPATNTPSAGMESSTLVEGSLRYACPYEKRYAKLGKQRCTGELLNGFQDMGRVKEHIERAHLREQRTCSSVDCPRRGERIWRAVPRGRGKHEQKRLENSCPHNDLDEEDYVWQDEFKRICSAAGSRQKTERWAFFYRKLFRLPDDEPIPNPFVQVGSVSSEYPRQPDGGVDAFRVSALERHDEDVLRDLQSKLGSVVQSSELQAMILNMVDTSQRKMRGA